MITFLPRISNPPKYFPATCSRFGQPDLTHTAHPVYYANEAFSRHPKATSLQFGFLRENTPVTKSIQSFLQTLARKIPSKKVTRQHDALPSIAMSPARRKALRTIVGLVVTTLPVARDVQLRSSDRHHTYPTPINRPEPLDEDNPNTAWRRIQGRRQGLPTPLSPCIFNQRTNVWEQDLPWFINRTTQRIDLNTYKQMTKVDERKWRQRWPDFPAKYIAEQHNSLLGEAGNAENGSLRIVCCVLDGLQAMQDALSNDKILDHITSEYRSPTKNRALYAYYWRDQPDSRTKKIRLEQKRHGAHTVGAFDIACADEKTLKNYLKLAIQAGFSGFGIGYSGKQLILHIDMSGERSWNYRGYSKARVREIVASIKSKSC